MIIKETMLTAGTLSFRKELLQKNLYCLLGTNWLLKPPTAPLYCLKVTGIANGTYKISALLSNNILVYS